MAGNSGSTQGIREGRIGGSVQHVRFGVELLVSWVVVSLLVWALLTFAIAMAPPIRPGFPTDPAQERHPSIPGDPNDPFNDDPLLICADYVTRTHCGSAPS